jgi:hypothetical protein
MSDWDEDFHSRFTVFTQFSFFRSLLKLMTDKIDLITALKFFSAWPMAKMLDEALPPNPGLSNPWIVEGDIKNFLKQRVLGKKKDANKKLFWSLLQGFKRACKEAPKSFVLQSFVKHKNTLMCEPAGSAEYTRNEYRPCFDKVFHRMEKHKATTDLVMSASACWEAKRSDGGNREYLLKRFHGIDNSLSSQISDHSVLLRMVEVKVGRVRSMYGLPQLSISQIEESIMNESDEFLQCQVSPVLEPLKVRLITKGQAASYYYSRKMQKIMHSHLKKLPQFSCIGEPLREEHIYDMISRENFWYTKYPSICKMDQFVSGDYSAATDGLSSYCTIEAFESVLDATSCSESEKVILRRVLYSHEVSYPEWAVKDAKSAGLDLEPFTQKTGQLMGSTLSFPILCIVNFVCYWKAFNSYLNQQNFTPHEIDLVQDDWEQLPCLINGDDIMFRANEDLYSLWNNELVNCGFKLSIGKNYINRNTFTMNSQLYTFNWTTDRIKEINYYNPGLLFDQSSTVDLRTSEFSSDRTLTSVYNKYIEGATNKIRAHKKFIHYHKMEIQKYTDNGRLSLGLPDHLGGLGFKIPEGVNSYMTRGQLAVASYLYVNPQTDSFLKSRKEFQNSDSTVQLETWSPCEFISLQYGPLESHYERLQLSDVTLPNSSICVETVTRYNPISRKEYYGFASLWKNTRFIDETKLIQSPKPMEVKVLGVRSEIVEDPAIQIPDELKDKMYMYADKIGEFIKQTQFDTFCSYILSILASNLVEERELMPITIGS